MSTLTRSLRTFARAEDGATTAEYGIIIVVVAGIAIFVLSQLNGALSTLYGKFNTKVNTRQLIRSLGLERKGPRAASSRPSCVRAGSPATGTASDRSARRHL